jgi:hypothetical protein
MSERSEVELESEADTSATQRTEAHVPTKGVAVMDMNEYVFETVVRDRLAEMRLAAERAHRIGAAAPTLHALRVALGHALIRIGQRLQGVPGDSMAWIERGAVVATPRRPTHEAVRG